MEWLARRIAELTKLSEVEVSYTTDRMVAGASLFSTVPRGQIGYGRLDVSHVPGELLKADEERGLIGKLWRELHRRWPRYATIVCKDILGPSSRDADTMDGQDEAILRALKKRHPRLLTQDELELESEISRRTISAKMKPLREAGLVAQPKGPKKGTTITPKGLELLKQVDKAQPAQ